MLKTDLIVVMPTDNPSKNMLPLIENLKEAGFRKFVVVNDGCKASTESFFETLKVDFGCDVLEHYSQLGRGRALKTAFNYILTTYPFSAGIITVDDITVHTVEEIEKCALTLQKNPNNMILGSRNFSDNVYKLARRISNAMKRRFIKMLTGINVSDTSTGLRGIPIGIIPRLLTVEGEGFDYELNTLLYSKEKGIIIKEFLIKPSKEERPVYNPLKHSIKIYLVFIKYAITSMFATYVDFLLFSVCVASFKMRFPVFYIGLSTIVARVISASINFYLSRKTVFKKEKNKKVMMARFFAIVAAQMLSSAILVSLVYRIIPITETVVKLIIDVILFFIFYQIQREWVFNEKKNSRNNRYTK